MKNAKLTLLILLATTLAMTSCTKSKKTGKAEDGSQDVNMATGGDDAAKKKAAEEAAAKKKAEEEAAAKKKAEEDAKKGKKTAPTEFTAIGGETNASKLFANLMKVDDKTDASAATLPLIAAKFKGEYADEVVLSVVASIDDKSKLHLDKLIGNDKLWKTEITLNAKAEKAEKKSVAAAYKLTVGDQAVTLSDTEAAKTAGDITGNAVKLEKEAAVAYAGALPVVSVAAADTAKVANLVLDLGKDPIAAAIPLAAESKDDCFIVAKNDVVPAGLILTKIMNGKEIDFSKLKKEELAKLPTDKEIAAYFVCGSVDAKEDSKLNAILFVQKAMKLTIKAEAKKDGAAADKK